MKLKARSPSIKEDRKPLSVSRTRISADAAQNLILAAVGLLTACLFITLQTTWLGRIPLLGLLPPAAPSLGLLLVLAAGFLMDRETGGIAGVGVGFLCDAAGDGGVFLLPLLYFLLGYLSGAIGRRVLAHNLPSFLIFSLAGSAAEGLFRIARAAVSLRGIPPPGWMVSSTLPRIILTLLASPVVYLIVKSMVRAVGVREVSR